MLRGVGSCVTLCLARPFVARFNLNLMRTGAANGYEPMHVCRLRELEGLCW